MILELTVKNFRSIENQTFNLIATDKIKENPKNVMVTDNINVLSSSIIYGRNASGKSNFLKALRALKFLVMYSSDFKHEGRIEPYEPFNFDLLLNNKPTEFEITFITTFNLKFKYQIAFDREKILFESLYYYPKNKPAKLFLREINAPISYGEYYYGEKKKIENDLLPNQLFLSKSSTRKIDFLREAYLFFSQELSIYIFHEAELDNTLISLFAGIIFENENPDFKDNINNLLKASDVNIIDFNVNKQDPSKFNFPEYMPAHLKDEIIKEYEFEVTTFHKLFEGNKEIGKSPFSLNEESLGTKRLLVIGGLIFRALNKGWIIVIDELDKGLHPLLTRLLIQLFHNKKTNPYNAQLIFATHDSSLLDNELFRRDQIYFTEKDYTGKTSIYSLSDIKGVRKDVPYDKWYLSGRFAAIPIIEDLTLKFEDREQILQDRIKKAIEKHAS